MSGRDPDEGAQRPPPPLTPPAFWAALAFAAAMIGAAMTVAWLLPHADSAPPAGALTAPGAHGRGSGRTAHP